ncbi:probable aspartyl protease At4g16563 [Carica papaya]|uniref:probable aspartyl protease At4g16563 n=1 Tax=Carica papaya TaxID=3649 RepID=UPI000B8CA523|nr:probable aspartyl protease At4g16563 [Carica papaya]
MAASSSSSYLLCLISLVYLLISLLSIPSNATITIPLSFSTKFPSSDPVQILNHLATASLTRAQRLKLPKKIQTNDTATLSSSLVKTPLFAHSYGGYSISLSFGTPPQTVPFVFDTGSSLVWFPCTSRYLCSKCFFPNIDPNQIPAFIPKLSSSSKLVGCQNLKCSWIFGSDLQSRCQGCDPNLRNCTQACPPYILQYGLGSTAGLLLSETLDFPDQTVPNFLVGCSILSSRQPAGIAGFGRNPESLPSQMRLKKFSYCLVSRRFDETPVSSNLVLETGSGKAHDKIRDVSYTPFLKNPSVSNIAFQDYYYVSLRKIIIGDKHVKIPYSLLVPGPDGNGGTIVDSGSTFTFMERPVFEAVAKEFEAQMRNFSRSTAVETQSGLSPCFNISGEKSMRVPKLIFQFKGGAKMVLPSSNYLAFIGKPAAVCLMIVSDNAVDESAGSLGPAIILGNFQQQNFYVEFDLGKQRFGFAKQRCA